MPALWTRTEPSQVQTNTGLVVALFQFMVGSSRCDRLNASSNRLNGVPWIQDWCIILWWSCSSES